MNSINPLFSPACKPVSESKDGHSHGTFWAIICLLLIEIITFGVNVKRVGVYQDEWIYFSELHFIPHTLTNLILTLFWDPRMIVRPLEALHFGPLFFLVWERPLWYHLVCYSVEFIGGCFLFLALCRLCSNRGVALAVAVLFLVYPTHDATHYYITASGEQLSASFFTLSLWLFLKGMDESRVRLLWWSAFAYFLSIYNYEQTLPLVVIYPLLYFLQLKSARRQLTNLKSFVIYQFPFALVAASMVAYRMWLLPALSLGWHYSMVYDLRNFVSVIGAGVNASLSPYMESVCMSAITDLLKDKLPAVSWLSLLIAVLVVFNCMLRQGPDPSRRSNRNLYVAAVGVVILLLSYTIFGFSPEHMPTIVTWHNRVNICGSLGACMIIAGLLGAICDALPAMTHSGKILFPSVVSLLAGLFILVDWQFAKPWIISWHAQTELMVTLRSHASEIRPGDSIIIGGITRYASQEAPVVDGVWDWQSIVRTTLNKADLRGTVVTQRLCLGKEALVDRSGTLVLGTFPFKRMILYSPVKSSWVRISTRQEFIEQARRLGWTIEPTVARNG